MKIALHFPLPYAVEVGGVKYRLKPYFDNVLKVYALQKESELSEVDKLDLSLELLVKDKLKIMPAQNKVELLNAIYDALMEKPKAATDGKAPAFDFIQDAGFIYASFLMDYGLDLYEEQERLHWWKFYQLFVGLSDRTKIVQVMQIRTRPIPKPTKYNAEERVNLMRLKAQYALEMSQEDRERNFAAGLKRLGGIMQKMIDGR